MSGKKIFLVGFFTTLGAMILGGVLGISIAVFQDIFPKGYIVFPYDLLYGILILLLGALFILYIKNIISYKVIRNKTELDEDTAYTSLENLCFSIVFSTHIMIVVALIWMSIAIGHFNSSSPERDFVTYNMVASILAFILVGFAQFFAVKIYNKEFPYKKYTFFSANPQKSHFEGLDEGEKFIAYRISYSVFQKMSLAFMFVLGGLLMLGVYVQFHIVPILLVGGLWLTMYLFHYFETKKLFKVSETK